MARNENERRVWAEEKTKRGGRWNIGRYNINHVAFQLHYVILLIFAQVNRRAHTRTTDRDPKTDQEAPLNIPKKELHAIRVHFFSHTLWLKFSTLLLCIFLFQSRQVGRWTFFFVQRDCFEYIWDKMKVNDSTHKKVSDSVTNYTK